jgi:hypothetical protein
LGVKPSSLNEIYWSHSHDDLVTLVGIRTQYEMAVAYQNYESFRLVANEALGGGKRQSHSEGEGIQTMDELVRKFQMVGGRVGG